MKLVIVVILVILVCSCQIKIPIPAQAEGGIFISEEDWKKMEKETHGSIKGRLLQGENPLSGYLVRLVDAGTVTTDTQGRFTFEDLKPGEHLIIIKSSDGKEIGRLTISLYPTEHKEISIDINQLR